jgi:hypothetical protein
MKLLRNVLTAVVLGVKTLLGLAFLGSLSTDRGGAQHEA